MKVDDVPAFLETFRDWQRTYADVAETVARVAPVTHKFEFQSPEEFQARAKQGVLQFVGQLAGSRFHVRVHRHGPEAAISSIAAERLLGSTLCESLEQARTPGRVDFEDPDAILDVETIDNEAGLALWTREQRARYPFLKLD
jgi:tRNA(Ser,Leu) C12 N-acetylase TAN1